MLDSVRRREIKGKKGGKEERERGEGEGEGEREREKKREKYRYLEISAPAARRDEMSHAVICVRARTRAFIFLSARALYLQKIIRGCASRAHVYFRFRVVCRASAAAVAS